MHGAALALVVVLGLPAPTADPASLVGQLGSSRFAQREAAEAALTKLGRAALPALKGARGDKDPEVRSRASAILRRIEQTLLEQPTPVGLDFREVRLSDAVATINRKTGLALAASSDGEADWAGRRLTLVEGQPLPFWKAMDALCRAADAHYVLGGQPTLGSGDSTFPLYEGYAPPPEPVADSGPFRVHLASLHYQSEIRLDRPRRGPVARGGVAPSPDESARVGDSPARQFYLQLLVAAEPHLSITQNGAVRLSEAVDDRGRSLVVPPDRAAVQQSWGYYGVNPSPLVRLRVDLVRPDDPGRRIARIKGVIPVVVATRRPESLEIPLDKASSRPFRDDQVALAVLARRPARDGQPATIEVALRVAEGAWQPPAAEDNDAMPYRPESPQQQLEILDASRRPLAWFPSATSYSADETRLTLTLLPRGDGTPADPATLRYHGLIRGVAEIPFEFLDLPMP